MKREVRIMPHNLEAEQAVLGCLLIDPETNLQIMSKLKEVDFYTEAHTKIFASMTKIYNGGKIIDFVTLTDELERKNILSEVGGIEYITTLTNVVPSAANFLNYVEIVKRDSMLRKLIKSGQDIIENSYNANDHIEALALAEKIVFDISEAEDVSSLEHIGDSLKAVLDKFDKIAKDNTILRGVPTGFKDLDAITNGLQKSDLILLAARPGVGKTSLAMNLACHVAVNENKKVAIFSLEMPKEQLAQRSLCSLARVSMARAMNGNMEMDEWKSIWSANKQLANAGIFVDDSSMSTPIDILSKCRRLKRQDGLDFVVIDYLQLMSSGGKNRENRQQEVSEITRMLKIAAKELNVPILVLSQLSRAVETRQDHRPQLSDLRESGSIEQDADIVFFIYNPDKYNDVVSEDEPGVCELIIAKHRNGATGTIKLRWIGEYTTYVDVDAKITQKKKVDKVANESKDEAPMEVVDNVDDVF